MSAVQQLLEKEQIDLYVSASALRTLEACPREWWLRYVEGAEPEDRPARLVLGSALHEALAVYYRTLRDGTDPPGPDELLGLAHEAIRRKIDSGPQLLFAQGRKLDDLFVDAERLIAAFLSDGIRSSRVLAVEEPFTLSISNPKTGEVLPYEERIAGAIDLVIETEDGEIVVIDHKTSARSLGGHSNPANEGHLKSGQR
jgi:hypothetical protein